MWWEGRPNGLRQKNGGVLVIVPGGDPRSGVRRPISGLVAASADCDCDGNCPIRIFHGETISKRHIGKGESHGGCHLGECVFPRDALRCTDADFMGLELGMRAKRACVSKILIFVTGQYSSGGLP